MSILAVIFDLDGLLSDTERLHCQAYQRALAAVGVEVSAAQYAGHWIRDGKSIADFCRLRGLSHDPAALRAAKAVEYRALVESSLGEMPGATGCLDRLAGRYRLALGTSAYREDAMAVLRKMKIDCRFETIVTGSDVARAKPAPDIFALAAERLGVPPARCVVVEDAEKGVRAAVAAGMRAVAVPSEHTADNDFSLAWKVVASLDEVTPELLASAGEPGGN